MDYEQVEIAVAQGLAAWVLAHGFADLWRSGSLRSAVGEDDPAALFRTLASYLFTGPPGRDVREADARAGSPAH